MKFLQRLALALALALMPAAAAEAADNVQAYIYAQCLPEYGKALAREKADYYAPIVRRAAARHRLDPMVAAALFWTESNYNPRAVSGAGALGLGQVMPFWWDARKGFPRSRWQDPELNAHLSCRILAFELRQVEKRFLRATADTRLEMALVAYNMGGSAVSRGIYRSGYSRTIMRHARRSYVRAHTPGASSRVPGVPPRRACPPPHETGLRRPE